MPCPHLKEVVMLYCDAFPIKKMVPLDRVVSADPCLPCHYERCPLYKAGASLQRGDDDAPPHPRREATQ
jgi:hypothetical protein